MARYNEAVTVTRVELARALRAWDEKAKAEGWEDRDDDDKHDESADLLFELIVSQKGSKE